MLLHTLGESTMVDTTEQVYSFLCQYIEEHGYSPSIRDIALGCYIGRSTVIRHLDKLEGQGRISREPEQPRSIGIIDKS
jgi:repressor LexA